MTGINIYSPYTYTSIRTCCACIYIHVNLLVVDHLRAHSQQVLLWIWRTLLQRGQA